MNTINLFQAIEAGDIQSIKAISPYSVELKSINGCGQSLLDLAAEKGQVEVTRCLIELGADVEYSHSSSPLIHAIRGRNIEIVKILVNAGASVEYGPHGETPLVEAVSKGDLELTA